MPRLKGRNRTSTFLKSGKEPKTFTVKIVRGLNLASKDPNGKSDPYVKVYAQSLGQPRVKLGSSSRKKETLNPEWVKDPKKATFQGVGSKLIMEIWDHDR
eukprot:CAMPEP_0114535926 /NCGR_PEP_ID=MMETSP0109-20121206/28711_1 /TAXON_ID=29199 /ORGANISM="Chlorarachnion reptans, Strain CCCM449" /LENGTH=99 /DNA_ID=CAMNT_0001719593 /DNA_START=1 /DNA_END=297 /DNA_ORIENTATION=-